MIAARLGTVEHRTLWTATTLAGPVRVGVLVPLALPRLESPIGGAIAGEPDATDGGPAAAEE